MPFPLSILDLSPVDSGGGQPRALRNTIELARVADGLGYTRYWLAEHHNTGMIASSAPEIMIGHVAAATRHLRVGSGGIMLPNHAPLKVAETFKMLEALHPGRVDLGIGRAPGTDGRTAIALRRSKDALWAEDFPDQLADLLSFGSGEFPPDHPFRGVVAVPSEVPLPPIWLLGSSGFSAQLAAGLGLGFAFAAHINPDGAAFVMQAYREQFRPSAYLSQPHAILATTAICGETDAHAEELAATYDVVFAGLRSGRFAPLLSPGDALAFPLGPEERAAVRARRANFAVGSPETVRARLEELAAQTAADEVMVTGTVYSHAERVRSYTRIAAAFNLGVTPVAAGAAA